MNDYYVLSDAENAIAALYVFYFKNIFPIFSARLLLQWPLSIAQ